MSGSFVGRGDELNALKWLLEKPSASLVVVKGRRRIGKSRLIEEFAKDLPFYSFSGVPPTNKTTKESQLRLFSEQLSQQFNIPGLLFDSWSFALNFLAKQTASGRAVVLLDEISWMGSKDPDFMGVLKTVWDSYFKKNHQLILILCGSISAWIENHILKNTGFVGRISRVIELDELPLGQCGQFWGRWQSDTSAYEKFKWLSVTGGVPRYLEELRPELSVDENLKALCFSPEGFLVREFEQIFEDVLSANSPLYKKFVQALVSGPKEPGELCRACGTTLNSTNSDYLDELVQAGFLARDYTWHIGGQKPSRLSHYRLRDNYARFYLKFIEPKLEQIKKGFYRYAPVESLPGWYSILGLQYENLVLNNRRSLLRLLNLSPEEVVYDNPFFQRKTAKRAGCQIDYLIQSKHRYLYVCEVKLLSAPVGVDVIAEMKEKMNRLALPRGYSYRPVLIHVNGVSDAVLDRDYFAHIIDFGRLLD